LILGILHPKEQQHHLLPQRLLQSQKLLKRQKLVK